MSTFLDNLKEVLKLTQADCSIFVRVYLVEKLPCCELSELSLPMFYRLILVDLVGFILVELAKGLLDLRDCVRRKFARLALKKVRAKYRYDLLWNPHTPFLD